MTLLFGPVIKSAGYLANSKLSKNTFLMEMLDHSLDNSRDKDDSDGCIVESKAMIVTQNMTIVEEDGSLGSGEDQSAVADLAHTHLLDQCDDDDVHYRFESDQGGVTYRVVHVGEDSDAVDQLSLVATSSFPSAAGGLPNQIHSNGPFYVLSPEVYGTAAGRALAPRSTIQIESTRGSSVGPVSRRDDRRRATHNEVERRRRDKINQWIIELSKLIPGCSPDSAKTGQVSFEGQSKGGILAKACEYIKELRSSNAQLMEVLNDNKRLAMDLEIIQQANDEFKRDNDILRQQLSQHGILPSADVNTSAS